MRIDIHIQYETSDDIRPLGLPKYFALHTLTTKLENGNRHEPCAVLKDKNYECRIMENISNRFQALWKAFDMITEDNSLRKGV